MAVADLFDQETVTARIEGADTVVGTIYRIVTQATLDFTTVGAPANTVGTVFIATSVDTLGSGDALSEITAPAKGIPATDPWPALAGAEAITAQNDRDFSSGTIGNWVVDADGTGTCAYSAANLDGADDKQALLTSTGDTYLYASLPTTAMGLSANKLYRVSAKRHVPAANTNKTAKIAWNNITGEIPTSVTLALSDDTYETISGYFYLAADIIGDLLVGFSGDPTDGDLMYIDDISIRPVQFSWKPYGTNLVEIDETEDALKITYVDNTSGAYLYFRNANDLSADLTVGETYIFQFDAKVGSGDALNAKIESTPDVATGAIAESWTTYKLIFIADHATAVHFLFNAMGAGEVVYIRNLILYHYSRKGLTRMGMSMMLK